MKREFFATCTLGLESALAQELRALGAADVQEGRGGATFFGDLALGYSANLWLRSATRVQERLLQTTIRAPDDLYAAVSGLHWERFMAVDQTLAVEASVRDSCVTHSGFAALRVKDAVVDQFRKMRRRRPNVDTRDPDLPLHLVLKRDRLTLYRNLSGASLHKRGYRPIQVKSPLNEATAAGLILLSGIDLREGLVDPMCGSGTILIEAALIALDRAPGASRSFAFERWPDFDREIWLALRDDARARARRELPVPFEGADAHPGALDLARTCAKAAQVHTQIGLSVAAARDFEPARPPRNVFTNPPWGERLEEGADDAWRELGTFLHQRCRGAVAHVLCGQQELTRLLGLRASRRHPVRIGPIDCRLLRYEVRAQDGGDA